MCFSIAAASRPVQPAMISESIAIVAFAGSPRPFSKSCNVAVPDIEMPWNVVVFEAFLAYLAGPKAVNRPPSGGPRAKSGDVKTDRGSESARPLPTRA